MEFIIEDIPVIEASVTPKFQHISQVNDEFYGATTEQKRISSLLVE